MDRWWQWCSCVLSASLWPAEGPLLPFFPFAALSLGSWHSKAVAAFPGSPPSPPQGGARAELTVAAISGPTKPPFTHRVMERSAPPTNREWTLVCSGRRDWKSSTSVMLMLLHMDTSKHFSWRQSCPTAFSVLPEATVVVSGPCPQSLVLTAFFAPAGCTQPTASGL